MINIDFNNLNKFEKQIHKILYEYAKNHDIIRINKAAEICECSISKISKFVKKLGFVNYKQYLDFLQEKEIPQVNHSNELIRISNYIDDFNDTLIDEMLELIENHNKILLFGLGPSLIVAQYFEYRLRLFVNKTIVAVTDEISLISMTDESTLLIIITATGAFHSFENIYTESKKSGCNIVIVAEEYNTNLFGQCDRVFCLTNHTQPDFLLPFEKSRTVFFIFFEEVIQRIINKRKS